MSEQSDFLKQIGLGGTRSADQLAPVEVVKTPFDSLNNVILGCGGIPRGRTVELYGPPSSGKTTIAINFCAWYIQDGLAVAWDDREGTFPGSEYTDGMGLDRSKLTFMDTGDGNDALYQFQLAAALDIFDLYVIDSMAAIIAKEAGVTGSTVEFNMNKNLATAKLWAQFFRELRSGYEIGKPGSFNPKKGKYNKSDLILSDRAYLKDGKETTAIHKLTDKAVTLILINHMRTKIGQTFGDKAYTSGGDATKFDSSIRLRVTPIRKSREKINGLPAYKVVKLRADKNKVAPPFGEAWFNLHQDGHMEETTKRSSKGGDDDDTEEITDEDLG